jgi:CRP-like cAMP-binding protein
MDEQTEPRKIMENIPWFKELKPVHFDKMAGIASVHTYPEGGEVFREGDREDRLYVILEGRVAIEIFFPHRGRIPILTAEPLDTIGWSSVTPNIHTRTASARAVLPTRVIGFDSEALRRLCDEDHELGYLIMRRIANIIAGRLMVTRLQLLDMFAAPPEASND